MIAGDNPSIKSSKSLNPNSTFSDTPRKLSRNVSGTNIHRWIFSLMEVNLCSLESLPRFEKPMSKIHINVCIMYIIYICGCTHIHIYYIYTHKQLLALGHLSRLFFLGAPNIGPLTYLGQVGRNPPGNPAGEKKVQPEVAFLF